MTTYDHWHVNIAGAGIKHSTTEYQRQEQADQVAERAQTNNPSARVTVHGCGTDRCTNLDR